MSVEHSFYAVYGVELDDPDAWLEVYDKLEELRGTRGEVDGGQDAQMYIASGAPGPDRLLLGVAYKELRPGTCTPVTDFAPSPELDEALRRAVAAADLGRRVVTEPGWILVHDWS